jgi:hypothetical protein
MMISQIEQQMILPRVSHVEGKLETGVHRSLAKLPADFKQIMILIVSKTQRIVPADIPSTLEKRTGFRHA